MTQAINDRRLSAKELIFAVHGDRSGAYPDPTVYDKVKQSEQQVREVINHKRQQAAEKWDTVSHQLQHKKEQLTEKLTETGQGWVNRLGLAPKQQAQSWGEQVVANANTPIGHSSQR